jgi:hypothetical protein
VEGEQIRGIKVVGSCLYISSNLGLYIMDISDPYDLKIVNSITNDTRYQFEDMIIYGNNAYIASYAIGLVILDVSNPKEPTLISSLNTSLESTEFAYANKVRIIGNYAYVVNNYEFVIVDVSNIHNPFIVGGLQSNSAQYKGFVISGDYAYLGSTSYGLNIIDIRDPYKPFIVDILYDWDAHFNEFVISWPLMYAIVWGNLYTFDITDNAHPIFKAMRVNALRYMYMSYPFAFFASNDSFIVSDMNTFLSPEVSDLSFLNSVTLSGIQDYPSGLDIHGSYAYISFYSNYLKVVDISAYFSPSLSTLNVNLDPQEGGAVISTPAGISCPGDCEEAFTSGTQVTLTATPNSGYLFAYWDDGTAYYYQNPINITMDNAKNLTAKFTQPRLSITRVTARDAETGEEPPTSGKPAKIEVTIKNIGTASQVRLQ